MKHRILLTILVAFPLFCPAQEGAVLPAVATLGVYRGFSGGMMLHAGYQFGPSAGFVTPEGYDTYLQGFCYGIGGALRVHLWSHFRVGFEGYASTTPLPKQGSGSNIRTGWGGALADAYVTFGKARFFVGGTIGGGAQRATHVFSGEQPDIETWKQAWEVFKEYGNSEESFPAQYTKRGYFVFDPFLGMEYALTRKINMIVKFDYQICVHKKKFLTPSGPRLYLGIMFNHSR